MALELVQPLFEQRHRAAGLQIRERAADAISDVAETMTEPVLRAPRRRRTLNRGSKRGLNLTITVTGSVRRRRRLSRVRLVAPHQRFGVGRVPGLIASCRCVPAFGRIVARRSWSALRAPAGARSSEPCFRPAGAACPRFRARATGWPRHPLQCGWRRLQVPWLAASRRRHAALANPLGHYATSRSPRWQCGARRRPFPSGGGGAVKAAPGVPGRDAFEGSDEAQTKNPIGVKLTVASKRCVKWRWCGPKTGLPDDIFASRPNG